MCTKGSRSSRLAGSRLVTVTWQPAADGEYGRCSRHSATGALDQHPVCPGWTRALVNSIRYAVSHAVGRHAASSKVELRWLGDEVAGGDADVLGERAVVHLGEQGAPRVERLVTVAGRRVTDDRVDDDLVAGLVDTRRVAAQHDRQLVGG